MPFFCCRQWSGALFGLLLSLGWAIAPATAGEPKDPIHHELTVKVNLEAGTVSVTDRILLPKDLSRGQLTFTLASTLTIQQARTAIPIAQSLTAGGTMRRYGLAAPSGRELTISYGGPIVHPSNPDAGVISPEGVFLSGLTGWYPQIDNRLVTFRVTMEVPSDWEVMSQGKRISKLNKDNHRQVMWQSFRTQDEIYLLAGPWTETIRGAGITTSQVLLRTPDPELADRYLTATARYLSRYEKLIGPYPYPKFALVENFWETGYGMPSFTLLGSKVIRLPFIIDTSYPHEILHNWWGNGVFVDPEDGNWSEGLTVYLADYMLAEEAGNGTEYRRDQLAAYAAFVADGTDFPLRTFRARHNRASQAVGYGKSMMMFHMLRRQLGDAIFFDALKEFYLTYRFRRAGFAELEEVFSRVAGQSLAPIFIQWINRTGAPSLALEDVAAKPVKDGHEVSFEVVQTQSEPPYQLYLPITISGTDAPTIQKTLKMTKRAHRYSVTVPFTPTRMALDPDFDLFRGLDGGESGAILAKLFGSVSPHFILPGKASDDRLFSFRKLAESWTDQPDHILLDSELTALPDGPIWVLGWDNRFTRNVGMLLADKKNSLLTDHGAMLPGGLYRRDSDALAIVVEQPGEDGGRPVGWIGAPKAEVLKGLTRKLPHYTRYSYVVFDGTAPTIRSKGVWPSTGSALSRAIKVAAPAAP